jgi:Holliday junction resolvase RusA-like endonuclease
MPALLASQRLANQPPWRILPVESPDVLGLVLYGDPVAKGRARVTKTGHSYTPAATQAAERRWGLAVSQAIRGRPPDAAHAFVVTMDFYTQNWQRRDCDNFAKLVLDSLTGQVWADDVQVVELHVRIFWVDPKPRTELLVSQTALVTAPGTRCARCKAAMRSYVSWQQRRFCSGTCAAKCT